MRSFKEDGTPSQFSLHAVTADKNRNTGGKIIHLTDVNISGLRKQNPSAKHESRKAEIKGIRQPAHYRNSTMNLVHQESGTVTKIHPRLIVKFNGEKVYH